eukprot:2195072-Amphidinium_carterae.1
MLYEHGTAGTNEEEGKERDHNFFKIHMPSMGSSGWFVWVVWEAIADLEPTVFTKVDAAPPEGERPQELTLKEPTEEACGSYVAPSTISRIVGD